MGKFRLLQIAQFVITSNLSLDYRIFMKKTMAFFMFILGLFLINSNIYSQNSKPGTSFTNPINAGEFREDFTYMDSKPVQDYKIDNESFIIYYKFDFKNSMNLTSMISFMRSVLPAEYAFYDSKFNLIKKLSVFGQMDINVNRGINYLKITGPLEMYYIYPRIIGKVVQENIELEFAYDTSGNQTNRQLIVLSKSAKSMKVEIPEIIAERNVKIYPNPTHGQLRVEIDNINDIKSCSVVITSMMSGRIAYNNSSLSLIYDIDISNQQNGIYILNINIDGNITSWKILKI